MVAVTAVTQILQIPIMLATVGLDALGVYIAIFSFASIFSILDFGVFNTNATELIRLRASSRHLEVSDRINSMFSLLLVISIPSISFLIVFLWCSLDRATLFSYANVSTLLFTTLVLVSLQNLFSTFFECATRGLGQHVQSWLKMALARLLDFFVLSCALFLSRDLLISAVCMLISRTVVSIFFLVTLKRLRKTGLKPKWSFSHTWRGQWRANVGALFSILNNWGVSQGAVALISFSIGSTSSVVYSSVRTLLGGIKQVASAKISSATPEIIAGHQLLPSNLNFVIFRRLEKQVVALALIGLVGFLFFGNFIFEIWTDKKIELPPGVLEGFSFVSLLEIVALASGTWLWTKNRQLTISVLNFVGLAIIGWTVLTFQISLLFVSIELSVLFLLLTLAAEFQIYFLRDTKSVPGLPVTAQDF